MRFAFQCVPHRKHYVARSVLFLTLSLLLLLATGDSKRQQPIYMNQFAVHIPSGHADADEIASKHGFRNLGQVVLKTVLLYPFAPSYSPLSDV